MKQSDTIVSATVSLHETCGTPSVLVDVLMTASAKILGEVVGNADNTASVTRLKGTEMFMTRDTA